MTDTLAPRRPSWGKKKRNTLHARPHIFRDGNDMLLRGRKKNDREILSYYGARPPAHELLRFACQTRIPPKT